MCPFCMATSLWIAAGAVSTGGLSLLVVTKFCNSKKPEQRGKHDQQPAKQ
ncbi:hypothetical protein GRAN_1459 [Granulicella sibirica]|uniref:Uncharacterized protein n=1 Tax=Granulicella sibirica TaxID=2479048 RepID=A0A4Q0T7Z8_9BACT|nr:hypothetical protein GRAN_1459 [Granulicella sibirica]